MCWWFQISLRYKNFLHSALSYTLPCQIDWIFSPNNKWKESDKKYIKAHWIGKVLFNLTLRYTNKSSWLSLRSSKSKWKYSSIVSIIQIIHMFFSNRGQMSKTSGDNGLFRDFDLLVLLKHIYSRIFISIIQVLHSLCHLDLSEMKRKCYCNVAFFLNFSHIEKCKPQIQRKF